MLRTIVQAVPFICFIIIGIIGIRVKFKFEGHDQDALICMALCMVAVIAVGALALGLV